MEEIIRKPELLPGMSVSDTTIWRWEKKGEFPRRIKLGGNSVGWFKSEVDAWLQKKSAERGA
jgi:predicted DNA-binding transcriptional regulator AlpA